MCAMAHRDFKGSVVLMSTNHKSFSYPVHRSFKEYKDNHGAMTVNNEEDTIVGALFASSDELDSDFDIEPGTFASYDGDDISSDGEMTPSLQDDLSPTLGSVHGPYQRRGNKRPARRVGK
jgi:hypothetical protein